MWDIVSLIRSLEMMALLAIDLGIFEHESVNQLWARPIVDWVEYVRTGL
ncbi:uncharacterized protein LOC111831730 [Capsella rubella]|nr:uncharacterized protein LOC111831730 [Capsella rubella]